MRKKNKEKKSPENDAGLEHPTLNSDFYSSAPVEQPLYQEGSELDRNRVRQTGRHRPVSGLERESIDPREKIALLAIMKAAIMILMLLIAFFMLWKGIKLYEESIWMDNQSEEELSPVMLELPEPEIIPEDTATGESFADRIEGWQEADRLVGLAGTLLLRNNHDEAIMRCQDALRLDPAHMAALNKLGELYVAKKMYPEAINTYIRLVSIDPSDKKMKRRLITVLAAHEDAESVVVMAQWFRDTHGFDENVHLYYTNALFKLEEYAEAAAAYERLLTGSPQDAGMLQSLASSYMYLEQYEQALIALEKLQVINYRDVKCYHQILVCHAQLGHAPEVVQILGKAAHLFGQNTAVSWIGDPQLDPVRQDPMFQTFADRVGGKEYRLYLENMAKAMKGEDDQGIDPQLQVPNQEATAGQRAAVGEESLVQ
jgi:tetratricopeptide (TPR) repeat protein